MNQPTLKPKEHSFIPKKDELSNLINEKANALFQKMSTLDVEHSGIDAAGKYYFTAHHTGRRLVFSIESSALIIYDAVKRTNKSIPDISFTDYGAGLGTLFLLAGMMDFKNVYYNDLFPEWTANAKIISDQLGIRITDFISGDIDSLIDYGKKNMAYFDIIASRNVIEHIYSLRQFYHKLFASGLTTLCYATTTANYHNIAMRFKHYRYHHQLENNYYKKQRAEYIRELVPNIHDAELFQLVKLTRGRAFHDFADAVNLYMNKQKVPEVEFLKTNTCDFKTGVWAENLITRGNYKSIIEEAGYSLDYTAGFWDTHYQYAIVNIFTKGLNQLIKMSGKKGCWFAPFVNVVAYSQ